MLHTSLGSGASSSLTHTPDGVRLLVTWIGFIKYMVCVLVVSERNAIPGLILCYFTDRCLRQTMFGA